MHILSPWLDTTPSGPTRPALDHDLEVDVCVIGGGITGLTTALALSESGRSIAVLEMDRLGAGVTGYTTAKLAALQSTTYSELSSGHGEDGARVYAEANAAAIDLIEKWSGELGIDCDFRRKAHVVYTTEQKQVSSIQDEAEAARKAGLDARLVDVTELPYEVKAAVRLDGQAEFHPRKYLLGLAETLESRGVQIFEQTRATGVSGKTVSATGGKVTAEHVVVATHYPFLDRAVFFARLVPMRSYCIAVRVNGELPPEMYYSIDSPSRSLRRLPLDGEELLIVGGEGHQTGEESDERERYQALEDWARQHFAVTDVPYRWSAQDPFTADGMPYIGAYTPLTNNLWTGTGFRKWGLTNGTAAGVLIADLIQGRENPWADEFDPNRVKPLASAKRFTKENVKTAVHFFGDRLKRSEFDSLEEIAPGEGGLVTVDGEKVGAFRREDGVIEAVKPVCTHLGCHVNFNKAEKTWDCPCHGSRFKTDGTVIEGPATKDLQQPASLTSSKVDGGS
jgi:glycine/D-amino acid oxidase-like deaminating enzyme/nitrite reductase/ring-hydroxylating ferredoxin subunit